MTALVVEDTKPLAKEHHHRRCTSPPRTRPTCRQPAPPPCSTVLPCANAACPQSPCPGQLQQPCLGTVPVCSPPQQFLAPAPSPFFMPNASPFLPLVMPPSPPAPCATCPPKPAHYRVEKGPRPCGGDVTKLEVEPTRGQCDPCKPCRSPPPRPVQCVTKIKEPKTTTVNCHHHHHEVTKKCVAVDKCSDKCSPPAPRAVKAFACKDDPCGGAEEEEAGPEYYEPETRLNTGLDRRDIMPPFEGFVAEAGGGVADKIRAWYAGVRPADYFVRPPPTAVADPSAYPKDGLAGGNAVYGDGGPLWEASPGGAAIQTSAGYISEFLLVFLLLFMAYILWIQKR